MKFNYDNVSAANLANIGRAAIAARQCELAIDEHPPIDRNNQVLADRLLGAKLWAKMNLEHAIAARETLVSDVCRRYEAEARKALDDIGKMLDEEGA